MTYVWLVVSVFAVVLLVVFFRIIDQLLDSGPGSVKTEKVEKEDNTPREQKVIIQVEQPSDKAFVLNTKTEDVKTETVDQVPPEPAEKATRDYVKPDEEASVVRTASKHRIREYYQNRWHDWQPHDAWEDDDCDGDTLGLSQDDIKKLVALKDLFDNKTPPPAY
jgi:hypothetical protein